MKVKVKKICAIGSNLRLMWITINCQTYCIRISHSLYEYLYDLNVPTSQKLRYENKR